MQVSRRPRVTRRHGRAGSRLADLAAVARGWSLDLYVGLAVGFGVAVVALEGPIAVPGRGVNEVVTPLLPIVLVAAHATSSAVLRTSVLERGHPHYRQRRLVLLGVVLVIGAVVSWAASSLAGSSTTVLLRNMVLFLGVLLLAGKSVDSSLLGLVLYGAACWVLGSNGLGVDPEPWALPLLPAESVTAAGVAALSAVAGTARLLLEPR